ncbi:MAG: hypothetical protein ACOC8N_09465 [Spirochaetota bacterium]
MPNLEDAVWVYLLDPGSYLKLFDLALALAVYVMSVILFLRYKRDYMVPLLFIGLFLFPLQFSIWFLRPDAVLDLPAPMNILEVVYIFFIKFGLLVTLLLLRR